MLLTDIAMVAADTSRSRVYLQSLKRNRLLPGFVLILGNESKKPLPGVLTDSKRDDPGETLMDNEGGIWSEASCNVSESIYETLDRSKIPHQRFETSDIHHLSVLECMRNRPESTFIYSGYGGIILKKPVFLTGKRFLHVHGGYLPYYKGSTTNYFSLITEDNLGASSLFLNEEIDSGPILLRKRFPPPPDRKQVDHIYDSAARAKVLVETLSAYQSSGDWKIEIDATNRQGETYFIIHPVLKHIAILSK